jgi:CheY-like chemotaxis protein
MANELQGKRVLIAEDQFLIADDLQRVLQDSGAKIVGPVRRKDDTLRQIASQDIDVAVLDINLDDESVYPAADELRRRGIPFIFVTGYSPSAVRAEYRSAPHIEKPYDSARLVEAVSRALGVNGTADA